MNCSADLVKVSPARGKELAVRPSLREELQCGGGQACPQITREETLFTVTAQSAAAAVRRGQPALRSRSRRRGRPSRCLRAARPTWRALLRASTQAPPCSSPPSVSLELGKAPRPTLRSTFSILLVIVMLVSPSKPSAWSTLRQVIAYLVGTRLIHTPSTHSDWHCPRPRSRPPRPEQPTAISAHLGPSRLEQSRHVCHVAAIVVRFCGILRVCEPRRRLLRTEPAEGLAYISDDLGRSRVISARTEPAEGAGQRRRCRCSSSRRSQTGAAARPAARWRRCGRTCTRSRRNGPPASAGGRHGNPVTYLTARLIH